MNAADAEEYTQALGQVVAGGWRQVALGKRLGVPSALGLSVEAWVEDRLGGYLRLSIPDRREAVIELTHEGMSTREIGEVLGVTHPTVINDQHAGKDLPVEEDVPSPTLLSESTAGKDLPPVESEPPTPDELANDDVRLRRSRARKMLSKAEAATSDLSPSVESIVEAVVAQHPDEVTASVARIERNWKVWGRLKQALAEQSNQQLRRVK